MKKEIFRTLGHKNKVKKQNSEVEFACDEISNRQKEKQQLNGLDY